MDLLRSCYSTEMQFFDGVDHPIPVKWFFCEEGAQPFPHWHRFGSGNWASERANWFGTGEILEAPRPWRDGSAPRLACGDDVWGRMRGLEFHGPLSSYQRGCQWGDTPLNATATGLVPDCMPLPPFCDLILLDRINPQWPITYTVGQRIRLYHRWVPWVDPLALAWIHINPEFQWPSPEYFGFPFLEFHCGGLQMVLENNGNYLAPADLVSADRRTFYWENWNALGTLFDWLPREYWRCIITFNFGGIVADLFRMNVQNLWPGPMAAGTSVGMHPSGVGVLPASAAGTILPAVAMTTAAIPSMAVGEIQLGGRVTLADWSMVSGAPALVPGKQYWLDPFFPGHITMTPPSTAGQIEQLVGEAINTTTLKLVCEPAVLL